MDIAIATYDAAERAAIVAASYPAIRSFAPVAFDMVNFPARVVDERELVRYADILQELNNTDETYRTRLYSSREAELIVQLSRSIETLTQQRWGRPVQPFTALFTPVLVLRALSALAANRPLSVFEIGPGSGHFGAYAIFSGFRYCAVDNTQSLYLWQNRLFRHVVQQAGRSFADYATDRSVPMLGGADVEHVPWWHFAGMFRAPPRADVIVCDATMGEMSVFALHYVIRLAARMLDESPVGAILFRHIGEPRVNTLDYVRAVFGRCGFVANDLGPVTAYSRHSLPLAGESPPIGGGPFRPACEFLPLDKSKLLDSYEFFEFLNLKG